MANFPFDPRGYMNMWGEFLSKQTPKAKIGAGASKGFANARPIDIKSITGKASNATDDILSALFAKGRTAGLGGIAQEVGVGARAVTPLMNPALLKSLGVVGLGITGGQLLSQGVGKAYDMYNKATAPAYKPSALKPAPLAKANIKASATKTPALPALPNVAPSGSYPSYEQILKDAGVPSFAPINPTQSQAGEYIQQVQGQPNNQTLAQSLGLGNYVAPEQSFSSGLANDRLKQIMDYLNRYTPEAYRDVIDQDARTAMRNQTFARAFNNPALANIPSELERQAKVLEYLKSGYETDINLSTQARKLAEAEAIAKATGLPASWMEDSKDILANIIRPQITSKGQIDLAKQYGANAYNVAQLNNVLKKYGIDTVSETAKSKNANALEIAKLMANSKIPPAMLGAMGFGVDPAEAMQLLQQLGVYSNGSNPNLIPSQTNFAPDDSF